MPDARGPVANSAAAAAAGFAAQGSGLSWLCEDLFEGQDDDTIADHLLSGGALAAAHPDGSAPASATQVMVNHGGTAAAVGQHAAADCNGRDESAGKQRLAGPKRVPSSGSSCDGTPLDPALEDFDELFIM